MVVVKMEKNSEGGKINCRCKKLDKNTMTE